MNTQHTPGNWIAKTYSTETIRDAVGIYAGSMTLPIVPDIAGRSIEECDANIRLIAAAPDLLAAAQCALADFEGILPEFDPEREHPAWETLAELRAAITKAKGENA